MSRFKDKFEILSISADDHREALESLLKTIKIPGIQTWDLKDDKYPIVELYNIQGFPTWYLLDANGVIRARDPLGDALIPAIEAALKPIKPATAKSASG